MAKGYWIVGVDVSDPEQYKAYQDFVRPYLAATGGRFTVRGGPQEVVEGKSNARTVVIEFESYEAAQRAYHSVEYQSGRELRRAASLADFVIVEGFDG